MPKEDDKGNTGNADQMKEILDGMKNLTNVVGSLATGLEATQKNVTDLTSNVGNLSNMNKEQIEANRLSAEEKNMADDLDANDLEGMDRSQFLGHIMGQVNKGFESLSNQMSGQVDAVRDNLNNGNLKSEFNSVREAHSDFDHYKTEIADIAKQNPEMKISDMYTLAKANNPEKVVEVTKTLDAEKLVNDKVAAEEAAKNKTTKPGYGGLTPTSGQRMEQPSDMTQENAGNSAWDETMANLELEK